MLYCKELVDLKLDYLHKMLYNKRYSNLSLDQSPSIFNALDGRKGKNGNNI